jgi:hypothetical protein
MQVPTYSLFSILTSFLRVAAVVGTGYDGRICGSPAKQQHLPYIPVLFIGRNFLFTRKVVFTQRRDSSVFTRLKGSHSS